MVPFIILINEWLLLVNRICFFVYLEYFFFYCGDLDEKWVASYY